MKDGCNTALFIANAVSYFTLWHCWKVSTSKKVSWWFSSCLPVRRGETESVFLFNCLDFCDDYLNWFCLMRCSSTDFTVILCNGGESAVTTLHHHRSFSHSYIIMEISFTLRIVFLFNASIKLLLPVFSDARAIGWPFSSC